MSNELNAAFEPIHFARATLGEHRHVCAFFDSPADEDAVMLPFLREGIERGEKAFCIVDQAHGRPYRERLAGAGIPVESAEASGQLECRRWEDAYLREGHFDQNAMLELIEEVLKEGRAAGFPLTRLAAHMEWAVEDRPGVDDLVEYETRLNYILPRYRDPVICMYETGKFSSGVVIDILRTHPMVMIGGVLHENPFYVPPDQFLRELRERGASRQS
jgi:hypothetical protein